jgi:CelD/BcsL family acetyltransferase involved in cellulose biosynthesis
MSTNTTIHVADTLEKVLALQASWQSMQWHPDTDLGLYLILLKTRQEIMRPYVITVETNGSVSAILVGRIEKLKPRVGLGYANISLPTVRSLVISGAGLLGDHSTSNAALLFDAVRNALRKKDAHVAFFHRMDASSDLFKMVNQVKSPLYRDYFPSWNDNWRASLAESYDQFLKKRSSNQRHNLKRYVGRFQEKYGDQIKIRRFTDACEIDTVMADTEAVARKTYQRGLNAGFVDDDETRQRMLLYAREKRLRALILYLNEIPIAFWNGFQYESTFYTWTTGFDPAYKDLRPGMFLLKHLLTDLCNEKVISTVDFGSGDADYKRHLSDANRQEVSLHLFAPNARGLTMNALRTPLIAAAETGRWGLRKSDLLKKIKKRWRSKLESQPT